MKNERQIFHVVKDKTGWKVEKEGSNKIIMKGPVKSVLVKEIISKASLLYSQVKIHKADGVIEDEKIFPKTSEPRKYNV